MLDRSVNKDSLNYLLTVFFPHSDARPETGSHHPLGSFSGI
jgi:hypothetical protein